MSASADLVKTPVRLLIVDDHSAVRKSIARLISGSGDLVVAGEAASGDETIEKLRVETFDLVLLDITMPGKHGLDVLKELKHQWPLLPVIILSVHRPEEYRAKAIDLGAAAYVTKDCAADELLVEVRRAAGIR